jgi:hypothetical protein
MLLDVVSDPGVSADGVSLFSIVHDEMYFIPEFLRHYRGIGVERFVFLDDASTDGTRDYLAGQPDCVVLASDVRYFDIIEGRRAFNAWRQEMLDRFSRDRWAVVADADEFLALPSGLSVSDVAARIGRSGSDSAWGVMVDMYPETIADLDDDGPFSLEGRWHFDARPHMRFSARSNRRRTIYGGSRSRLLTENRIAGEEQRLKRLWMMRLGLWRKLKFNKITKVPLVRWTAGHQFAGSHNVRPSPTTPNVLAIMHFKFTPDLRRKIDYALETGGYFDGSKEYRLMNELLLKMKARNRRFVSSRSRRMERPSDLYAGGAGKLN